MIRCAGVARRSGVGRVTGAVSETIDGAVAVAGGGVAVLTECTDVARSAGAGRASRVIKTGAVCAARVRIAAVAVTAAAGVRLSARIAVITRQRVVRVVARAIRVAGVRGADVAIVASRGGQTEDASRIIVVVRVAGVAGRTDVTHVARAISGRVDGAVAIARGGVAVLTERTDKTDIAETTAAAIAGAVAVAGVTGAAAGTAAADITTGAGIAVVASRRIGFITRIASRGSTAACVWIAAVRVARISAGRRIWLEGVDRTRPRSPRAVFCDVTRANRITAASARRYESIDARIRTTRTVIVPIVVARPALR